MQLLHSEPVPVLYLTYNRLDYTRQTLPALLERTPLGRIYIVDNGSTDGTREYLESIEHEGIERRIFPDTNTGISGAMNLFFELTADQPYVAKIDNDTEVEEGWLEGLLNALIWARLEIVQAKHFFTIAGIKDWADLLEKNRFKTIRVPMRISGCKKSNIILSPMVGGSGIVIRRDSIQEPIPEKGYIFGWYQYQKDDPGGRRGFFDGVYVKLLDKIYYNHIKAEHLDYKVATGRLALKESPLRHEGTNN